MTRKRLDTVKTVTQPLATLWSPLQLSEYLGLSVGACAQMRYLGTGPRFVKVGRLVRYFLVDVEAWLAENAKTRTDDARCA